MNIENKIKHLKNLGIKGDFTEVRKMYSGLEFNTDDSVYQEVIKMSKSLCEEFTKITSNLLKGGEIAENTKKRKLEILDILFPGHGPLFGGGDGLNAVIGLVDLDGMNYINTNVNFGKTSLIHIGEYTFLANNIKFGDENILNNKMGKIEVGSDSWICAGVHINDNSIVSSKSVISLGANITSESKLTDETIVVGNPAYSKHIIVENKLINNMILNRSQEEIKDIVNHVKKLGISGNFSQYEKQLKNMQYNTLDPTISQIFDLTHNLCSEYNLDSTSKLRKRKILDTLFYTHGQGLEVGNSLFVDIMGTVNIGNYVYIGNGVNLCGNIKIGDNATINDNCMLQAIGHKVHYLGRKLTTDENGNVCEFNIPTYIEIAKNVTLGKGTKISKGIITYNTEKNEIIR